MHEETIWTLSFPMNSWKHKTLRGNGWMNIIPMIPTWKHVVSKTLPEHTKTWILFPFNISLSYFDIYIFSFTFHNTSSDVSSLCYPYRYIFVNVFSIFFQHYLCDIEPLWIAERFYLPDLLFNRPHTTTPATERKNGPNGRAHFYSRS